MHGLTVNECYIRKFSHLCYVSSGCGGGNRGGCGLWEVGVVCVSGMNSLLKVLPWERNYLQKRRTTRGSVSHTLIGFHEEGIWEGDHFLLFFSLSLSLSSLALVFYSSLLLPSHFNSP